MEWQCKLTRNNMRDTDRSILMPFEPVTMSTDLGLDFTPDRVFVVSVPNRLAVGAEDAGADCRNRVLSRIPVDVLDALFE